MTVRKKLGSAAATLFMLAGWWMAAPAPAGRAEAQTPAAPPRECVYVNDSGRSQPIMWRPTMDSWEVDDVPDGWAVVGPCQSVTDGGKYAACGSGTSRVWTKVDQGWIRTRCFDRIQ